jgi:hypothetical protein
MHCGKRSGGKALLWLAIVAFALVLAGCGASAKAHHATPPQPSEADRMKAVVRAWNANVNAGNNAAEARLFSYPALISLMVGPYGCLCRTPAEVVQFHAQLLCTGKIVSIKVRGRYATAVFGHPGDRETSKCDSTDGAPASSLWRSLTRARAHAHASAIPLALAARASGGWQISSGSRPAVGRWTGG